ncbi:IPT/TIG domain-containing protein [Kitasatospora griseola]|uniref:IPT/TIG domain-containing protein n=1 Tax=Kitasatospora griseola TaxID=2064 RepID=UPI003802CC46
MSASRSPDGTAAYVANLSSHSLSVVDTATSTVTASIPLASSAIGVAITPDGATAYVTLAGNNTVVAVSTSTHTVTATIPVGAAPQFISIDAAGAHAYVPNFTGNSVSVISIATNTVTATVSGGFNNPIGVHAAAVPVPAPTVTGLSPASGPRAGGTSVTITGTNLLGATAVTFGSTPAASFTVNSDTSITAVTLAHTAGAVDVTVTTASGTSAVVTANQYTYLKPAPVVTGISPIRGDVAGGTTVTITGTDLDGATAVDFGSTAATSFTVNSPTSITVTTPAVSTARTVDVTVTTDTGTSPAVTADQYTYVNTLVRVQGAGRVPVGTHAGQFGVAVQRTSAGGAISGHLEFQDQASGVHLGNATFTDVYTTASGTAYATGTATCRIGGTTSTCAFTLTATDGGKNTGSFILTYNTTVGGTILAGHVTVSGAGFAAPRTAAASAPANPVAAVTSGLLSANLLGITLSSGECGTGALVATGGTATGEVSCLLLGAAGATIDVDLPATTGTTGTNTATLGGTATVTVAGALPLPLPATASLAGTGSSAGLQLTVAGVTLPVLPIGTGGVEIG